MSVPYSIVAPVYFMDNIFAPWNLPALREGRLTMAMPADRPLQQVAVSDIGAFAATLVERREAVFGKRFDIAGDELTGTQAAAVVSKAVVLRAGDRRIADRQARASGYCPMADPIQSASECTFMTQPV